MRHVHVHVTQKDIDQGQPGKPGSCPVALALLRRLTDPDLRPVVLTRSIFLDRLVDGVMVYDELDRGKITIPQRITDWIVAFDQGEPVMSINFTLAMPPTVQA